MYTIVKKSILSQSIHIFIEDHQHEMYKTQMPKIYFRCKVFRLEPKI